jgi:glycerate dehydrogenase
MMKSSAFLVNTSRGGLINEPDLVSVLNEKLIGGAALDVLSIEPPGDNPLIGLQNCIITPHTAWVSIEARRRILDTTAANISAFLSGNPQNVVNG